MEESEYELGFDGVFFFFWQIRARILHSNVENNVQNITKTREI